ncbi:hypothetical protein CVT24_013366 [Panaeolus cyanescens]|uniref:F-box domain-containing protein n=1 Tax=Panaeolus cyanescens TaxID=181874 RepID=A0A409YMM2_9AGAR|nr:hypothetical protein CVT24_013366 [Panaeolus cyanescens]
MHPKSKVLFSKRIVQKIKMMLLRWKAPKADAVVPAEIAPPTPWRVSETRDNSSEPPEPSTATSNSNTHSKDILVDNSAIQAPISLAHLAPQSTEPLSLTVNSLPPGILAKIFHVFMFWQ